MASSPFKNVIIAGASGTIGAPITRTLLSTGLFAVSVLSRPDSKATFPTGIEIKRANLTSHAELVEALKGQDVLICTLNDSAAELQPGLIEAAYEAGVKRVLQNEWAAHEMAIPGTPLEEGKAGRAAIIELLNHKSKQATDEGREFYWTGINNGTFFDWALYASFLDISLPPNQTATIWNGGNVKTTLTTLSTVSKSVVSVLTTAEPKTRNTLLNISSFTGTQLEVIAALEKATNSTWSVTHTTRDEQLVLAAGAAERGEFLNAFYIWIKACIWSGEGVLPGTEEWNKVLGLEREVLEEVVGKVLKGEEV